METVITTIDRIISLGETLGPNSIDIPHSTAIVMETITSITVITTSKAIGTIAEDGTNQDIHPGTITIGTGIIRTIGIEITRVGTTIGTSAITGITTGVTTNGIL